MMKLTALVSLILAALTGCSAPATAPVTCSTPTCEEADPDMLPSQQTLGWSASGKLVTGSAGATVSLQQTFPVAGMWTVQFAVGAVAPIAAGPGAPSSRPQAVITWTVAGNPVSRTVDVGNGVSVSGVGEAVRVTVTDQSNTLGFQAGNPYFVSITVAPGTRPSGTHPPTLRLVDPTTGANTHIAPLASATFALPQGVGAKSVAVYFNTPAVVQEQWIVFQQAATVGMGSYLLTIGPPVFVPLAPGVDTIKIQNNDAANGLDVILILGIDG